MAVDEGRVIDDPRYAMPLYRKAEAARIIAVHEPVRVKLSYPPR